jgi:hypothetical protein
VQTREKHFFFGVFHVVSPRDGLDSKRFSSAHFFDFMIRPQGKRVSRLSDSGVKKKKEGGQEEKYQTVPICEESSYRSH